jgi:hypothetical protein
MQLLKYTVAKIDMNLCGIKNEITILMYDLFCHYCKNSVKTYLN